MTLDSIDTWHMAARPHPTAKDFSVQLGCHLEEVFEMFTEFEVQHAHVSFKHGQLLSLLKDIADTLKKEAPEVFIRSRKGLLDSLCDQIVTAVGVGHCASMSVPLAVEEVDRSNWSKYVDGKPVFDANGKIAKGPDYVKPDLTGMC